MADFIMIDTGQLRLRAAVAGDGPLVLMVHGFPESWYSWRHQIGPIAQAGFKACAIDVRGYGGSDKPHDVSEYSMERMVGDITGVADALSPDAPAVLVGHDWGAPMVWNSALICPDRFRAVCAMSVPFTGVPKEPFTDIIDRVFTQKDRFFYQAYFQHVGPPEAEAEADITGFLRKFYYSISGDAPDGSWPNDKNAAATLLEGLGDPAIFPPWMSDADIAYYAAEFTNSGLRGPINRYRNHERDFIYLAQFRERCIEQPALFIAGSKDPASNMLRGTDPIAIMRKHVPNLDAISLEGCGHWTQQERPIEVNAALIPWLQKL